VLEQEVLVMLSNERRAQLLELGFDGAISYERAEGVTCVTGFFPEWNEYADVSQQDGELVADLLRMHPITSNITRAAFRSSEGAFWLDFEKGKLVLDNKGLSWFLFLSPTASEEEIGVSAAGARMRIIQAIMGAENSNDVPRVAMESVEKGLTPFGADDLDFFNVRPVELTSRQQARQDLIKVLKEFGSRLEARRVLRPAGVALCPTQGVEYYFNKRVWSVEVDAKTEKEAIALGKKLRKQLIGPRKVGNVVHLHEWPLYVIYEGGYTRVDP
jgi:hypothetical protein